MMALYMPMQPSSNTPMMAFSRCSCRGQRPPSCISGVGGSAGVQVAHVAVSCVDACPSRSHCRMPVAEPVVGEVLAPERGVVDAHLGQRGVQVEQPDQARPLAGSSWRR